MSKDLLLRNVRPMGGAAADVLIQAAGSPRSRRPRAPGTPVEEGARRHRLPGLVEAHTHLDKNLLGLPWQPNAVGPSLLDKIDNERQN